MTKEAGFMCEPNLATMHSTSRQMCADDYTQYCIHQYTVYSILLCCFSTQWRLALLLHHEVQFGRWCPVSGWCCSCRSSQDCCCHDGAGQHLDTDQMSVKVDQSNMQALEHWFSLDWTAPPPSAAFPTSKRPIWMGQLKVTLIWYKTLSKTESYSPQFQTWMARPLGTKTLQVVVCRILMMLPWGKTSSWMEWDYPMLIARLTLHFALMLKGI